ncbi:MAG: hypothetical protein ACW99F_04510 [Candidatus Hodarchaeales archaeon]|jgi:hypothetical protein
MVRLRFEDYDRSSHDIKIATNNLDTALYYAKKLENQNNWVLVSLCQVIIVNEFVWLTKYYIQYTERGGKMVRLKRPIFELFMNLLSGEILESPGVSLSSRFYQNARIADLTIVGR